MIEKEGAGSGGCCLSYGRVSGALAGGLLVLSVLGALFDAELRVKPWFLGTQVVVVVLFLATCKHEVGWSVWLRLFLGLLALGVGLTGDPPSFNAPARVFSTATRALALLASLAAVCTLAPGEENKVRAKRLERFERFLVLLGMGVALGLVAHAFARSLGTPRAPDLEAFLGIASLGMDHPYDTSHREPFHFWVLRLSVFFFGKESDAPRIFTALLYLATVPIYYVVTKRLFSRTFGAVAALLFSLSVFNADMSVQGLRNEEITLFLLGLVAAAKKAFSPSGRARDVLLTGILAGLLGLTYISLFFMSQLFLAYEGLRGRVLKRYGVVFLIGLVAVVPHFIHNQRLFGDPLASINRHAKFYRNKELAGKPGYPKVEEVAKDSYAGDDTTTLRYMFHDHGVSEAFAIFVRGALRLATYRSPAFDAYRPYELSFLVWTLAGLGLVSILLKRRTLSWVVILVGLVSFPVVFPLGAVATMESRLTNQALFAWLWLGAGLCSTPKSEEGDPFTAPPVSSSECHPRSQAGVS